MALSGEAKKAYQRELMRKRRAEKATSDLGLKEAESETTVPRTEMSGSVSRAEMGSGKGLQDSPVYPNGGDQQSPPSRPRTHPVYPWLKMYEHMEYDENGLVLKEQRCELCNRTWSTSIKIECPYCHGKGVKIP